MIMGFFSKEEKGVVIRIPRWMKTLFVLITMFISLLLFSAPILLVIADAVLPSALLSAALSPPSLTFRNYDFRYSLIDIPLISIIRSAIILCVYSFCDGPRLSRGPYLGITTACSAVSLVFVILKISYGFINNETKNGNLKGIEVALFTCSWVLAIGHVVVAYKTSCRERRKLLVYNIDIESVSACKNGYHKIIQEARTK